MLGNVVRIVKRRRYPLLVLGLVAIFALALSACAIAKPPLTVNSTADRVDASPGDGVCQTVNAGECTLRAAIQEANAEGGSNTIDLQSATTYPLTISGTDEDAAAKGDLDITSGVTIQGNGATIDANHIDRVLDVLSGGALTLRSITLTGGTADDGAGLRVNPNGNADVYIASIVANQATGAKPCTVVPHQLTCDASPSGGGGVFNQGSLVLSSVVVQNNGNTGTCAGDCVREGGGVTNAGVLTMINTTLAGNVVSGGDIGNWGGGLLDQTGATLAYVTIVDNQGDGSAIFTEYANDSPTAPATVLQATAIAGPGVLCEGADPTPSIVESDLRAPSIQSEGYNVAADGTCDVTSPTDHDWTNPLLAPLADNGGPTLTAAPYDSSPVVDLVPSGSGFCVDTFPDQRGEPRLQGDRCDAGAVEGTNGQPSPALHLTVNDANDRSDTAPGDGTCTTVGGGCTLRAAIDESNAAPYPDTITIAPGINPTLTRAGGTEDGNVSGDLDVTDSATIEGNGATVNGGAVGRVFDFIDVYADVHDLTITNGAGGIRTTDSKVDLNSLTVTANNAAGDNSGIGIDTGASLLSPSGLADLGTNITDSTITGNTTSGISTFLGGVTVTDSTITGNAVGINAESSVAITGSTISGNSSTGILATNFANTDITVADSSITGNGGGGVATPPTTSSASDVSIAITGSTISNNTRATTNGAGISVSGGTLNIDRSTVSGNRTTGTTAAPHGGGVYIGAGTITVTNSTVSNNTATSPVNGAGGGGISIMGGTLTVANSTLSGNTAGGTFSTHGGAVEDAGGTVTIRLSTITANVATFGRSVSRQVGSPTVSVSGSLLQESASVCNGTISSGGYNVVSDATCAFTAPTDLSSTSAGLGVLAGNGGPTQTHLPGAGSPAIDSIPTGTSGLCDSTTPTDQRGIARPQGTACDRGSVEQ